MILQSLYELYDRLKDDPAYKVAPRGYSLQKIAFKVVITPEGKLFQVQDARDPSSGRPRPKLLIVPGGSKTRGKVTEDSVRNKVRFLRNDLPFMLGVKVEQDTGSETAKRVESLVSTRLEFEAFRDFHLSVEDEIGDASYSAVCSFLRDWNPETKVGSKDWTEFAGTQGVFRIVGAEEDVHDRPAVRRWWEKRIGASEGAELGQCLISGELLPIARIHEPQIKGVGGRAEALLVSFNKEAHRSFGKDQSHNAPVSEEAALRYAKALNALLDGPMKQKHRLTLGDGDIDMKAVFWTEKPSPTEDIFAQFAEMGSHIVEAAEVQDEAVRQKLELFLRALREGREAYTEIEEDPDRNRFFLLGLSPNEGRISVRFFHRSTLSELLENLRRHYRDIKVERQPARGARRGDPEFPSAWLLLRQTARESKKIPPVLAGPLLRAIVSGSSYPTGLYSAVMRRIHADRQVNYARACVIKAFLVRNLGKEVSMSLDQERTDPAYRLGRLFAALEKTQQEALPDLKLTIRDHFYSSASATPRAVFPRLFHTYTHHLSKLKVGTKIHREKLVQQILEPLAGFPAHLDLTGQGLFALGYYHQREVLYAGKKEQITDS